MNAKYEKPVVEVIVLEEEDVVQTSGSRWTMSDEYGFVESGEDDIF